MIEARGCNGKGDRRRARSIGDVIPILQQSVSMPDEMLVLLHIEEQAIVQVIIKEVASHLDLKDNSKINTVSWHAVMFTRTLIVLSGMSSSATYCI